MQNVLILRTLSILSMFAMVGDGANERAPVLPTSDF
jgi:hypothetical protein